MDCIDERITFNAEPRNQGKTTRLSDNRKNLYITMALTLSVFILITYAPSLHEGVSYSLRTPWAP